jgi:hypothetical protein
MTGLLPEVDLLPKETLRTGALVSDPIAAADGDVLGPDVDALAAALPAQIVDAALADCGYSDKRVRLLPVRVLIVWLLAWWLTPRAGYREALLRVWPRVGGGRGVPSGPALVQARQRVGPAPFKALWRRLCGAYAEVDTPGAYLGGRRVGLLKASVDGTVLDVADSNANRAAFGDPGHTNGLGRFPQIRLLTLIASGTRTVIDAVWGPVTVSEIALLSKLVFGGALRRGMLVIADRYFDGMAQIHLLAATGADVLVRCKDKRHLAVHTELSDGSYLTVLPAPARPPRHGDTRGLPAAGGSRAARLRRGLLVRVVEATIIVFKDGHPPRICRYRLLTTLLDPTDVTAAQLTACYHERWESETAYAELKTYLRGAGRTLRSQTPTAVAQELYALLIAFQIVQITRARAAAAHPDGPCDPDRISFTSTLHAITRMIMNSALTLHCIMTEIHYNRLIDRRARSKPRALAGSERLAKQSADFPPGPVSYSVTTRTPAITSSNA